MEARERERKRSEERERHLIVFGTRVVAPVLGTSQC